MVGLWVVGLPILGITFLWMMKSHHNDSTFRKRFIIIYQGYKPKVFYWEFVNMLRKVLLAGINVFVPPT